MPRINVNNLETELLLADSYKTTHSKAPAKFKDTKGKGRKPEKSWKVQGWAKR